MSEFLVESKVSEKLAKEVSRSFVLSMARWNKLTCVHAASNFTSFWVENSALDNVSFWIKLVLAR